MSLDTDLIRRLTILEQRLDSLVFPEVSRWQDWTPAVTQSGSVAATINFARYTVLNDTVHLIAHLSITGTGTAANDVVISGIPSAVQPTNIFANETTLGTVIVRDAGSTIYQGSLVATAADTLKIQISSNASFYGTLPNVALANGDRIGFEATYER